MFNVPPMKQLPFLAGLNVPPIFIPPLPSLAAAEGPRERVALATGVSLMRLFEAYARARRQVGGEPVMVLACGDSAYGRMLIARRRGLEVLDELTAPLVWAWSEQEAAEQLGPQGWEQLSTALDNIGHVDGGMRVLLAVNGPGLEARVFRMGEPPPAPGASPTAAEPSAAAEPERDTPSGVYQPPTSAPTEVA
jgi:hypothetical protein